MDALWFWLPKHANDPVKTTSSLEAGRSIVLMNRGDSGQCALIDGEGVDRLTRRAGLPALRAEIAQLVPAFRGPSRCACGLGSDQAAHCRGQPAGALVSAGAALYRRRSPCDVAPIGRGARSRSAGRGGGGEHSVAAARDLEPCARPTSSAYRSGGNFPPGSLRASRCACISRSTGRCSKPTTERSRRQLSVRLLAALPLTAAPPSATGRNGCAPRARAYP